MKKNFIYNFLLTGSNLLFPLLTFPYLSRILGADGLGICNFIISYGQNYVIIAALGIPVYATREIAKVGEDKAKRSKLFFEILSIHLFFTGFLLIIYFASIFLYADLRQYKDLAILGGSLILFNVFSIEWLFSGVNNFKYITIRSLIIRLLSVIAIFVLVKGSSDFYIYFIITTVTVFFTVLMDIYYSRNFITRKISLTIKGIFSHIRTVALLGVYMILTSVYSVLPATLLGFLSTKSAVGYYYGANRIVRMVISVFTALVTVMIPKLNQTVENKKSNEYLLLLNKTLVIVISFGIPITFFLFLLADPIVMLLAGKNFVNSVFVLQIMAPIVLIVAFAQIFVILILSVNRKDKEMVILSFIGMLISVFINLIFISEYAERATGFSQLLSEFFVTVYSFFLAKKIINFHFPVKIFIMNIICVIPFSFITYLGFHLISSNIFIILFSGLVCAIYFLFYQLIIIKNDYLSNVIKPYLIKIKMAKG